MVLFESYLNICTVNESWYKTDVLKKLCEVAEIPVIESNQYKSNTKKSDLHFQYKDFFYSGFKAICNNSSIHFYLMISENLSSVYLSGYIDCISAFFVKMKINAKSYRFIPIKKK